MRLTGELNEGSFVLLILSAGMPRSGSTWLYNVIRILITDSGLYSNRIRPGWVEDLAEENQFSDALVKLHEYDKKLAAKADFIFYSFRDIRDALASAKRKFGRQPTLEHVDFLVEEHSKWILIAQYSMKYEDMLTSPQLIINAVATILGIKDYSVEALMEELNSLSYQSYGERNGTYNSLNLFHKDHITSGKISDYQDELSSSLVQQINDRHQVWFEDNGYL